MLFRQEMLSKNIPEVDACKLASEKSSIIGRMWRDAPKEVQDEYARKALIEKQMHAEKYPGYVYQPKPKAMKGKPTRSRQQHEMQQYPGCARTDSSSSKTSLQHTPYARSDSKDAVALKSARDKGKRRSDAPTWSRRAASNGSVSALVQHPYGGSKHELTVFIAQPRIWSLQPLSISIYK